MGSASDNQRIAKNTMLLYIRTVVVLLVSLYTSRIVLKALGEEDYGIYTVVGGIIALMSFFQAAQSKSTSRFITYELGRNGVTGSLRKVFSAALTIHIGLALAAIVLCETIGLWILYNWIKVPPGQQTAALVVFQFSILVFCVHLVRIPYDSVVIAHEEMSVFAYFSIIEALLQLGIAFMVKYAAHNALILYAGLMAASTTVLLLLYYLYVRRKYPIYRYKFTRDKALARRMLSFSGWTLLGSGANAATQQGFNILMNNFVGLVANAAMGLTNQVNVAVSKFVTSFSTAFTPQIIKLYAQRQQEELNSLISSCSKFSFALCYLFTVPIVCNIDLILSVWLGDDVPQYTAGFCIMILVCALIDATSGVFNTAITATGNIRRYQLYISLSFILDLVCSFVLFRIGVYPVYILFCRIATRGVINMIIGMYFSKIFINFDIRRYLIEVGGKLLATVSITLIPVLMICQVTSSWRRLIFSTFTFVILLILCTAFILMNGAQRSKILNKLKNKI